MRKMVYIMLCLFLGALNAKAQESTKEAAKIMNVKYKGKPAKEERKPEFNKYDSSFNKKFSREKRKKEVSKRQRGKANARIREMETHNNKRNVEFARKMEQREIAAKKK
jgi:hypothetical protein